MYLRYKQKIFIAVTLLIVVAIVLSAVYLPDLLKAEKPATTEQPLQFEIDDRISPGGLNQGLILEVLRIRHRGLLDKIMKNGISWRTKPQFFFISDIDDQVYISKDVVGSGGASEILFNTWDTIFQENKIMRDVEEEQETSTVTLSILERTTSGIIFKRNKDTEKEKFTVTYDYRTGKWTGDDSFNDNDGYGHYLGEHFEVWFNIYQTDKDGDGIPYWTEVNLLNTSPLIDDSIRDPDGDGIPTTWEWKWNYNPHIWDDHRNLDPDIDGIENIEEYQMEKWFANPYKQDIYIEADGMVKGAWYDPAHVCWEESQQVMIERFAQHGINVYIDFGWPGGPTNGGGEMLPHIQIISQDSGMMLQFYNNHFADERKGIFRYFVVGHQTGFCHPSEFNRYDTFSVGTNLKRMLSITGPKKAFTPRKWRLALGVLMMHECGHSLGITPWTIEGCDNRTYALGRAARNQFEETWGQYRSVMNYFHTYDYKLVDYSDGSNGPPYDQNDWLYLYLPTFQIEAQVIEEPYFETPGGDKIVAENPEFKLDDWTYNKNLTNQYNSTITTWTPIPPVNVDIRIYQKTDGATMSNGRNIKIYARPQVYPTYAEWSLIQEGYLDEEGTIHITPYNI